MPGFAKVFVTPFCVAPHLSSLTFLSLFPSVLPDYRVVDCGCPLPLTACGGVYMIAKVCTLNLDLCSLLCVLLCLSDNVCVRLSGVVFGYPGST